MNVALRWLVMCMMLFVAELGIAGGGAEDELKALEQKRYDALISGDFASFGEIMTDGFLYNHAGGGTITKAALVEYLKTGEMKVRKAVLEDTLVRLYGDVAVVTGKLHSDITTKGEEGAQHTLYLHVWVREGDRWKLDAAQHTYLPATAP